jgi:hypothetical protein
MTELHYLIDFARFLPSMNSTGIATIPMKAAHGTASTNDAPPVVAALATIRSRLKPLPQS